MKMKKKRISLLFDIILIGTVITIFLIIIGYKQYSSFNIEGVNWMFPSYPYSDELKRYEISKDMKESKNVLLSKSYYMEGADEKQIRFRYLLLNPFYKGDIIRTDLSLFNEAGEDITSIITEYTEDFWGCQGMNLTLVMNEDTYIPQKGDKLLLTATTPKGTGSSKSDVAGHFQVEFTVE